jgi:hypothetical protein
MYPCPEHKLEWDDYGEADEFLVKMALDANAPDKDNPTEPVCTFFNTSFPLHPLLSHVC